MEGRDFPIVLVLEQEIEEWQKFRRALRKKDQQLLDQLFEKATIHVQAGVEASRPWPFQTILISILREHEKALIGSCVLPYLRRILIEGKKLDIILE